MNERIRELSAQATRIEEPDGLFPREVFDREKFAELIVKECVNTLEFHGFEDAIPYVKWMATNKLGQHFGV
jgi:hypothetical protein